MGFQRRRQRQTSSRALSIERLDGRLLLAADSFVSGAEGEGETHIVQQQGERVFVIGRADDNDMQLLLGLETHRLTVDDMEYTFDANTVTQFQVAGAGGDDELQVIGTSLDDRVLVEAEGAEIRSSQYRVVVESFETIRLLGNSGDDSARILDSPGDDDLFMHSTFSAYVAAAGPVMKISGFESVEALASGGNDHVRFYDSAASERFNGRDGFSFMVGDTFSNLARGFERVDAFYRTGGDDEAILRGSSGDDELIASPDEVVFNVAGTVQVIHDFPVTRAFAEGGNDIASLTGQAGVNDIVVGDPETVFLRTPDVAVNFAVGFDRVEAFGNDRGDRAELSGDTGDDEFVGLPNIAELRGAAYQIEVNNFGLVRAFGRGGNDRAHLQDSIGDDRLEIKDNFTFLRDAANEDYTNYVEGFVVNAVSVGGADVARATEYGGEDFLLLDGTSFLVFGPDRSERVTNFVVSTAVGDDSGLSAPREPYSSSLRISLGGTHNLNKVLTPAQQEEALARLDEPRGQFSVVEGNIDFESGATSLIIFS